MARPKIQTKEKRVNIAATVTPKAFAKANKIAKKRNVSRSVIVDEAIIALKP